MELRQINATGKSLLNLVPPEGRSRVVTSAGRDAVDAAASGAQIASRTNDAEAYGEVVSF
jgi:hypothetical protein